MPNRIIREGILTSERVELLDEFAELFYRRLMSIVDDFGRYFGQATLLRTACYPRRPDRYTDEQVSGWMEQCSVAGLVALYVVGNTQYIEVIDFNQRLREGQKSKWPSRESAGNSGNFRESAGSSGSRAASPSTPSASAPNSGKTFTEARTLEIVSDEPRELFENFLLVFQMAGVAMNEQDKKRCAYEWVNLEPEDQRSVLADVMKKSTDGTWPTPNRTRRPWNYLEGKEWTRVAIPRILPEGRKSKTQEAHERAAERFVEGL